MVIILKCTLSIFSITDHWWIINQKQYVADTTLRMSGDFCCTCSMSKTRMPLADLSPEQVGFGMCLFALISKEKLKSGRYLWNDCLQVSIKAHSHSFEFQNWYSFLVICFRGAMRSATAVLQKQCKYWLEVFSEWSLPLPESVISFVRLTEVHQST